MKAKIYDINGSEDREIDINESVFNSEVNDHLIYEAVNNELANLRQGNAVTKTRGFVKGSTKKLYRQKGTGRARAGTAKSPVRVGGGTAFGPQMRDYTYSIGRRKKRIAIKSVFSKQMKEGNVKFVENFTIEDGKTKNAVLIFKKIAKTNKVVFILKEDDKLLKRAVRNISGLSFLVSERLNCKDLFYAKEIIIQEGALEVISKNLNKV